MFETRNAAETQQEFWIKVRRMPEALLRRRGAPIERIILCRVLYHGKHHRGTLLGRENLCKRQFTTALSYHLSLLMRNLTGTAKQWLVGKPSGHLGLPWCHLVWVDCVSGDATTYGSRTNEFFSFPDTSIIRRCGFRLFSTGF